MNWIKNFTLVLAASSATLLVSAQEPKNNNKKADNQEEIIIRKNGDASEKMTIVIEGEKVTVNGKAIENYNGKNLNIIKRKRPAIAFRNNNGDMAFSMPGVDMNLVEQFAPAMAGNKALLGVTTEKVDNGAKINSISDQSAAAKAGLMKDDIITKIGETAVTSPADLVEAIGKYKPADKVEIAYLRSNKSEKTTATLGENKFKSFSFNMNGNEKFNFEMPERPFPPSTDGGMFSFNRKPKIGMQVQDVEVGNGVKVNEVEEDSPADKSGFKEGDIISMINGKSIAGVDDLKTQLKDLKEGDQVKVEFNRGGKMQSAEIKLPKRLKTADL